MKKKRSAISKITLNTATFSNELVTPTYINLFFGWNGAGKSSIAKAIEAGGDVDWKAGEPEDFETEIASCFDEQYQNDQSALAEFQMMYKSWTQAVIDIYEENLDDPFPKLSLDSYKDKVSQLKTMVMANLRQIERKVEKPVLEIELDDVTEVITEIDTMIDGFNIQIKENNDVVNSKKTKKKECEDAVWEHLASMFGSEVTKNSVKAKRTSLHSCTSIFL